MGRLTALIPTRFAQECATAGFVDTCKAALGELADADSLPTALAVLGGVAGGPLAFLGIYAGGAFLKWKSDARQAEAAKAEFRALRARLGGIEDAVTAQKELAGLLKELLRRDSEMRKRLRQAGRRAGSPEAAFESVLTTTLTQLAADTDENFDNVRVFLSNISTWVVEGFERVEAKQGITHEKLDQLAAGQRAILANQKRIEARLEAIESTPATMPAAPISRPERPPLSRADRALFDECAPHADPLTRYRIAVAEGDDKRAGDLESEVERLRDKQRAEEDFLFHRARGDRHFYADRFDEAIGPYRAAMEIKPDEPTVLNNLALALVRAEISQEYGSGLAEAERLLNRALALHRAQHQSDHLDVAMSLNNLAGIREALGQPAEAERLYEQALAMHRRIIPGDHEHVARSLNNLAQARLSLGRAAEAEQMHESALQMRQRIFKGDHPYVAGSMNNLAFTRQSLGRYADAEAMHEQSLAMYQRLFKGDHPAVAIALNNLAVARKRQGRAAQAVPLYKQALAMRQRLFRGDHPDVARGLGNLGLAWEAMGMADKAEPLLEQALGIRRRLFDGDHPDVVESLNNLATTRHSLGRPADAERVLSEALAMLRRLYKGDHPNTALGLHNLACSIGKQGRFREALPLHEEAVAMGRRCLPDEHPWLLAWKQNLAIIRKKLRRSPDDDDSGPRLRLVR